jgi:DNA topoisomerase-6 subunit B
MAVRELVENSMDSVESKGIPPEVYVRIIPEGDHSYDSDTRPYRLTVADNGTGVEARQVPSAFGKVFYGSKYVLRQSRGMFGLGGTMAILYGQITTNKPVRITTSTDGKTKHIFEMLIDISENKPIVLKKTEDDAEGKIGTRVDLTLEGDYLRASQKISDYIQQTALVASYVNLTYIDPLGRMTFYERATTSMPLPPRETLPHPHGVDVEAFKRLLKSSEERTLQRFMVKHFHRVGDRIAARFLIFAGVKPDLAPEKLTNQQIVLIVEALQRFPEFLQPDASVLSPVGEEILLAGMIKELDPEFSAVVTRPPSSYSGFPFLVEAGVAYGSKRLPPGITLYRFANRIPLLYDECYSNDTRVLTRNGFKLFSALSYSDEIATLNPTSGKLEYQKPTRIINYHHRGPMIRFKSGFLDLQVTPNHRMYCARHNKPFELLEASDLLQSFEERAGLTTERAKSYERAVELRTKGSNYSSIAVQLSIHPSTVRGWLNGSHRSLRFTRGPRPYYYVKRDANWDGEWDAEFFDLPAYPRVPGSRRRPRVSKVPMNTWLRFLGWYLAEGSAFRDKGGYVISIGLGDKDLRYKSEIDDSLRALGVEPHWIRKGEHSFEIRFTHRQLYEYVSKFGHAADKFVPSDIKALPRERLHVLLEALMRGDGTITKSGSLVFGTVTSHRLADDVAEIALKCGFAVTFGYYKEGVCVYLNVRRKTTRIMAIDSVQYDGSVWCATVPNHVMLVERNGKTLWCGNSSDVAYKVVHEEIDWRHYHVPQEAPIGVVTDIVSTRIPYKTVGKEYIADRPEIEKELRNAMREALRRLSIYLSRKSSVEASQKRMNIYGKYLPLIARFATDLAGKKKIPDYRKLIGIKEKEQEKVEELTREAEPAIEAQVTVKGREQKKIDEFG